MTRALHTAATGMHAQQTKIDTIANNLANVNTTGYKQARVEFQDLVYQTVRTGGTDQSGLSGGELGTTLEVGLGVRHSATARNYEIGNIQVTNNPLDVAIQGRGFFKVRMPSGEIAYTRDGSFRTNSDGEVVTSENYPLDPPIRIDAEGQVHVGRDGTVSVVIDGEGGLREMGKIRLVNPTNPNELRGMGGNLYRYEGTEQFQELEPGIGGTGTLMGNALEGSNVEVVEEMVQMILGQRAYEASSKVIQTADRMLEDANRLR